MLNAAVGAEPGEMTLFRRVGRSGNTSIAGMGVAFTDYMHEPPEQRFTIEALRIDDLLERVGGRVDFIKIDVEGAEPLAFAGASETISRNPQLRIVMEWAPGQIRHAGFDVAEFVRSIATKNLKPHIIGRKAPRRIEYTDLEHLGYQPGILLSQQS